MKNISLRRRFFINSAIVVISITIISAVLVDLRYNHQLETSEQQKLKLHIFNLLSVTDINNGQVNLPLLLSNPNFNTPGSDLWAAVLNQDDEVLWQSLSIEAIPSDLPTKPKVGKWGYGTVSVNNSTFFTTRYAVQWSVENNHALPPPILQLVVAQHTHQYESAKLQFGIWLALGALSFAISLLTIHFYVLKLSFKPINILGDEIKKMESGSQGKLTESYPIELTPITRNLNLLIDKEHKQREKYRVAMADLAHSLKTPISVIAAEIHQQPDNKTLSNALSRINETIEYQLRRSVISGHHLLACGTNISTTLDMVLSALKKINQDSGISVSTSIDPSSDFMGDENDLLEIFGNIIDNAFKHAKSRINIECKQHDNHLLIIIEDDGKGIPDHQASDIFKRGKRLDENKQGQGIGLSIVENIIASYDGSIQLKRSEFGGALFLITFINRQSGASH